MSAILGVVHLIVDLCTVTSICRAAALSTSTLLSPFYLVVGYDVIAFALQAPLGVLVDRLEAPRRALFASLCAVAAGLLCISASPVATMVVAGVGNALFHVAGGALVLAASGGRAGPSGVYVAPGALGLGAGMRLGRNLALSVWPLGPVLAIAMLLALLTRPRPAGGAEVERHDAAPATPHAWAAITALLVSVAIRSFVGFGGPSAIAGTVVAMIGLPTVAFAGKLAGGYLADRLGWMDVSVGALLLSAPLIALAGGSSWLLLAGLLIFQTTMPVTLVATYRALPRWPATAFGLPCLALIAGAMPTFYPVTRTVYTAGTFLGLILVSAVAVAIGLHLVGVRRALRFRS
jgi:MFS transporter, FSR family, fosmidomycin resistance protein